MKNEIYCNNICKYFVFHLSPEIGWQILIGTQRLIEIVQNPRRLKGLFFVFSILLLEKHIWKQ